MWEEKICKVAHSYIILEYYVTYVPMKRREGVSGRVLGDSPCKFWNRHAKQSLIKGFFIMYRYVCTVVFWFSKVSTFFRKKVYQIKIIY